MKYFTLTELTKSATATRLKIDNTPTAEAKQNLVNLIDKILDPLREAYGKPIIVTSGYRCPKLNKAVGGSTSSQHMKGMAADIRTTSDLHEDNRKLYDLRNRAASISNTDDIDLLAYYNGNKLIKTIEAPSDAVKKSIYNLFRLTGYACDYYGADILKAPIEKLIRLTETLMGVNVEDYPDYETIINLLTERSVVKNENRRI